MEDLFSRNFQPKNKKGVHVIDCHIGKQFMSNTQPTVSIHDFTLNDRALLTHCASDFGNFPRECLQFWEETALVREAVDKDLRADALADELKKWSDVRTSRYIRTG